MKRPSRANHIAIAKMIGAMATEPHSIFDLADVSGLCVTTVRHYVHAFRKERIVFIAEWHADESSRLSQAAYSLGRKKDAARPVGITPGSVRWAQWRQRNEQQQMLQRIAA